MLLSNSRGSSRDVNTVEDGHSVYSGFVGFVSSITSKLLGVFNESGTMLA